MQRALAAGFVVILSLLAQPAFAQSKAKAENVREIPYDSVPNFLKLPPNLYLGEGIGVATNSKGHVFVYTRSADTRLFEFDQERRVRPRDRPGLVRVRVRPRGPRRPGGQHLGRGRGDEHDHQVQPRGARGDGARPQARGGRGHRGPRAGSSRAAARALRVQPSHRRRVGRGRQHLRHRRLRQLPRRQVRQERPVPQAGRHPRRSAGAAQSAPHDGDGRARGNVYVGDRGNARVQVFDNDLNLKTIYSNVGNPWAICISPGPHQYLFVSNSLPDNGLSQFRDITGEIYKMELDGTILGKFGKAGKQLKEVQHRPRDRLPQPERARSSPRSRRGAFRRSSSDDQTPSAARILRVVPGRDPRDSLRAGPALRAEAAGRHPSRRSGRRGDQLRRAHLRVHPDRQSDRGARQLAAVHARRLAPLRVRSERRLPAGDRGRASTGFWSRTPCASTRRTTSGSSTRPRAR